MTPTQELLQRYGDTGQTFLPFTALAFTLLMGLLLFGLPRRQAFVPLLMAGVLAPMHLRVVVAGFDFYILRIMILVGWVRVLLRSEHTGFKANALDKAVALWVGAMVFSYILQYHTLGALVNRMGFAYTALGSYFLIRVLAEPDAAIERILKAFVPAVVLLAVCMAIEHATGSNVVSRILAGLKQVPSARAGEFRSQASFAHSICAGTFGATTLPLVVALWWSDRASRELVILGVVAAVTVTLTSSSSGPVISCMAGIGGLCLWYARRYLRSILYGAVLLTFGLQLVMRAPVYVLVFRLSKLTGGSGWHRYSLIDNFIRRFSEWWLCGARATGHWGHNMWDTANMYVKMGVRGGLLTFALFIYVIYVGFKHLGTSMQAAEDKPRVQRVYWAIGSSLFAHVVAFFGTSYWDQMILAWYALLAIIATTGMASEPVSPESSIATA